MPARYSSPVTVERSSKVDVVLYSPGFAEMAAGVAEACGAAHVLCASGMGAGSVRDALCWERFPSDDPNVKLRVELVRDAHVVLLMSHENALIFEQLALISFLQRFHLPHPLPEYAAGKWKRSLADGKVDGCSVASLTIVIPWYRHCQMEQSMDTLMSSRPLEKASILAFLK